MPTVFRTPGLARVDYAHAVRVESGAMLITAGACPLDVAGAVVAPGDVTAQTEQVMLNLSRVLESAGATLHDVVKTTVYVVTTRRSDLVAAWKVVHAQLVDYEPASTLLGVAVLGYEHQLVEVEAVAALQDPGQS